MPSKRSPALLRLAPTMRVRMACADWLIGETGRGIHPSQSYQAGYCPLPLFSPCSIRLASPLPQSPFLLLLLPLFSSLFPHLFPSPGRRPALVFKMAPPQKGFSWSNIGVGAVMNMFEVSASMVKLRCTAMNSCHYNVYLRLGHHSWSASGGS